MGRALASAMVLIAVVCVMNSCSGGDNSPEGIVSKALTKLQEKDYVGYIDLIKFSETDAEKLQKQKAALLELAQRKFDKSLEKKQGLESWEVLSTDMAMAAKKRRISKWLRMKRATGCWMLESEASSLTSFSLAGKRIAKPSTGISLVRAWC